MIGAVDVSLKLYLTIHMILLISILHGDNYDILLLVSDLNKVLGMKPNMFVQLIPYKFCIWLFTISSVCMSHWFELYLDESRSLVGSLVFVDPHHFDISRVGSGS